MGFSVMRRLVFALSLLVGCVLFTSASLAQRACVVAPQGDVVCGPIVQPGYGPPREYREPRYDRREYDDRRYRDGDRRGPPTKCQQGYTVQDGECKPYRGPQKCQPGYTVQDGLCKPYTGR